MLHFIEVEQDCLISRKFYILLCGKNDKLIVIGDFNTSVFRDYFTWNSVVGTHVLGNTKALAFIHLYSVFH